MIRPSGTALQIHICRKAVDFRKQVNGLSSIIQHQLEHNPMSGQLFVFLNRKKDKIRILHWERNGYVLYGKYLEEDRFFLPKGNGELTSITLEQLNWLIDGVDISLIKPHPERNYDLES